MKKILSVLIRILILPNYLFGEPVYLSTDASGKTIYTSKPKSSTDKPIELPTIIKKDLSSPASGPQTCRTHGGINCGAGADSDGSVVCYDGFRDATSRFMFSCTTPKLEVINISVIDSTGSFKVSVRNVASVEAKGVSVKFTPEIGGSFKLTGESTIAGYESGEFVYKPLDELHKFAHPDPGDITVSCTNCL